MVTVPQNTVILNLVLGLGLCDSEHVLTSEEGAGGSGRDPWDPIAGPTY